MRRSSLALLLLLPLALRPLGAGARVTQPFDHDWTFSRGDAPSTEDPMFDDANWRTVEIPHDAEIEGAPAPDAPTGRGGGYRSSGVVWYRKRFTVPADAAGRRVFVEFDGVMANSDVWINGHRLGHRPSGYVSFGYELTGFLELGDDKSNLIAVRCDTRVQPASRWYTGEGIYRHVHLVTTDLVRVARWGLFASTPEVAADHAVVAVQARVENHADHPRELTVQVQLVDPSGAAVGPPVTAPAQNLGVGAERDFAVRIPVPEPQRWDLGAGRLYRAVAEVREGTRVLDDDAVPFGIREARFDAARGFLLNGRVVKLQGAALHHDGGAVGAAVPLRIWERRLEQLRTLGVNAIRTAHNPAAPEFLDLCDRLGFLVMDELFDAWTVGKPEAEKGMNLWFLEWYRQDARDTIRRDRNHPGIVLYSSGNEIHDTPNAPLAKNLLAGIIGVIREEDATRPITQALFRPNVSHDYANGLADMLDVIGTNYRDQELLEAQRARPTRKIVGTEQDHLRATWLLARDHPSHSGQFLWSGIDYLGEADWPRLISGSGLLDHTGAVAIRGRERQSWWTAAPMVFVTRQEPSLAGSDERRRPGFDRVADWTPPDPANYREAEVEVSSNCDEVELFLNDQSLGRQPRAADAAPLAWKVPYAPGTLRAVGRIGGHEAATHVLRTAGPAARLVAEVDRATVAADWNDVAFVSVRAVDAQGVVVPAAVQPVTFAAAGPGVIAAVDNADRADPAPFPALERRLFQGRCLALVKATAPAGTITISASAPGLGRAEVTLQAAAANP